MFQYIIDFLSDVRIKVLNFFVSFGVESEMLLNEYGGYNDDMD